MSQTSQEQPEENYTSKHGGAMLVVTCPNKQQKLEWHMGIEYGKAEVIFITGPKQAQQC